LRLNPSQIRLRYDINLEIPEQNKMTTSFNSSDDRLDIMIDQIRRLTEVVTIGFQEMHEGFRDIKVDLSEVRKTVAEQAEVAKQQALTVDRLVRVAEQQAEAVNRLLSRDELRNES
jgi:methyl-accepting chemotaxis protein